MTTLDTRHISDGSKLLPFIAYGNGSYTESAESPGWTDFDSELEEAMFPDGFREFVDWGVWSPSDPWDETGKRGAFDIAQRALYAVFGWKAPGWRNHS